MVHIESRKLIYAEAKELAQKLGSQITVTDDDNIELWIVYPKLDG